jgi:hypothetical protein
MPVVGSYLCRPFWGVVSRISARYLALPNSAWAWAVAGFVQRRSVRDVVTDSPRSAPSVKLRGTYRVLVLGHRYFVWGQQMTALMRILLAMCRSGPEL